MLHLGRFEARICDCGFHESLTGDKANHFGFEVKTCLVCRGAARFARIQEDADEQERKALKDNPRAPRSSDGRRVFTKLMSSDEVAALPHGPGIRRAPAPEPPAPPRGANARRRALAGRGR